MNLLVLCTGNSCRSQMAHGFLKTYMPDATIRSAGTDPHDVNKNAIRAMAEKSIDISDHAAEHVSHYQSEPFDYVITVCDNAAEHCPIFPGNTERLHWPFEDPAGATGSDAEVMAVFRRVRDEIDDRIKAWIASLPDEKKPPTR